MSRSGTAVTSGTNHYFILLGIYSVRPFELLGYLDLYIFLWKYIFLPTQVPKINKSCVKVFGSELRCSGMSLCSFSHAYLIIT